MGDEDEPGGGINPDHIKYAVLSLLVVGIIAVVFYAVRATSDNMGGASIPAPGQAGDGNAANAVPQEAGPGVDTVDVQPGQQPNLTDFQPQNTPNAGNNTFNDAQPTGPLPNFPGVDHLEEGDRGEWLPAWSSDLLSDARLEGLPVFVVSDSPQSGEFRSASQALRMVPQTGGIIEFAGAGPFAFDPLAIQEKGLVMLRGRAGTRPFLTQSSSGNSRAPLVKITNGLLLLEGVDFFVHVDAGPAPTVLSIHESRVRVRDCSIVVTGATEASTAIELVSNQARRVKCALEDVVIRGDHLTAVSLAGPRVELLTGNALLWSGQAPCLKMSGSASSVTGTAGMATRGMRLLATTCCSEVTGIVIENEGINSPAGFELKLLRSVFAQVGDEPGLWVDVVGWPLVDASEVNKPRMAGCSLAADSMRLVGWESLVRCTSPGEPEPIAIDDAAGWQRFWRQHASQNEFMSEFPTPTRSPAIEDITQPLGVWLTSLNAEIGARQKTIGGDSPAWPQASPGLMQRRLALSAWPDLETEIDTGWTATVTRSIDLEQERALNRYLNSDECPDGAHVTAYGEGLQQIDWLEITGKRIRLQFVQRGESPLIIQARPGNSTSDRTAWITVREGGTLELVGGYFRLPASSDRNFPRRLLLADGGRFAIRNCILEGATVGGDLPEEPLIEWIGAASPNASSVIESSLLVSPVTPLRVELGGRQLELRNSILTGQRDGMAVEIAGNDTGWLSVDRCTFASSTECMAFTFAADSGGLANVWVNETVFGPQLVSVDATSVLSIGGATGTAGRINWWEDRCGYTDRRLPGIADQGWGPLRGDGHALRFAEGVRAVLMAATLPEPRNVSVDAFVLDPGCDASHWSREGGAIGADIGTVGPAAEEAPDDPNPRPGPRRDF